ncbi:MAG: hypothetical protein KBA18_09110 [Kiritimatiellae bacterium]|nr:hypothetical protein [Kiritimatiellia bacterium]
MIDWKYVMRQYAYGGRVLVGQLGKYRCFEVQHNVTFVRDNTTPWRACCMLPGLKPDIGDYATEAEAKNACELALQHWLGGAGLEARR